MAITTADIHAAADRIAEAGQQPTLAAVRSALGGGSFTTISASMKAWKAAQLAAAQEAAHTAQAALAEAQKRADGLAALLELERAATKEARDKAEKALTDAARLAGKLEALQSKPAAKKA